ncbi:anti-sigma-I factor RsgI family protein [Oceanobacillus jeddahense]|uniref:RsgI N-terminal anti-sigma domain-containing protein n=1 Tax=Oceanobacillus jeddahense TaxID=1462527 RepID=A0ABY5K1G2_9BACI|nr:hypothetical protein [Oceanobacillus jeddahense]UUI05126.1 hypothetical protein NP439_11000 [Oceanobacillus jeddahense]
MKKGIVMEFHRKYAILLTKDGSFEKGIIVTEHAELGEEVIYQPLSGNTRRRKYWDKTPIAIRLSAILFILTLIIFCFPLLQGTDNATTHAYVAIDINPSIELELNDELVVTDINAINESGDQLIEEVNNIHDQSISSVVTNIVNESEDQGLADRKTMIVGVSCESQNGDPRELIAEIDPYIASLPDWEVATMVIPGEIRELVQNKNKSMNEVMATELANRNVDIEQVQFNMTDSDDRAIIDFFYDEEESDSDAGRSIEQEKIPMKLEDNVLIDDVAEDEEDQQDESI